jgi:hypothetical protein
VIHIINHTKLLSYAQSNYTTITHLSLVRQYLKKGLSYEIFGPVFWAVWMHLGLNVNRLLFLNFNDAPLILDNYLKF